MTFPDAPTSIGFRNQGPVTATSITIIGGPGNGLFAYSGTPALGNLIYSISGAGITADKFGNTVLAGSTSYDNNLHVAISQIGSQWKIYTSATAPPGPYAWGQVSDLAIQGGGLSFVPQTNGNEFAQFGTLGFALSAFYAVANQTIVNPGGAFNNTTATFEVDGSVGINLSASGLTALFAQVTGDAVPRFSFDDNGLLHWGTGAAAADVSLFREGIGFLGTNSILCLQNRPAGTPASIAGFTEIYSDSFTQGHTDRAFVTDLNFESKNQGAAPGAGGSGAKLFSVSGHQEVQSGQTGIGGDQNVYDCERLDQFSTGITINTTTGQNIPGLSKTLGIGKYKVRGKIYYVGNQAGGAPTIGFTQGFTLTAASYDSSYTVANAGATQPIEYYNNTAMDLISGAHAGPTLVNAQFVVFEFEAALTVSVAGTLTAIAKTSIAADTYTIQPNSWMEVMPVVAT